MAAPRRVRPITYARPEQAVSASASLPPGYTRLQWLKIAKQYQKNLIKYSKLQENETRLVLLKGAKHADAPVEIKLIEHVPFDRMGDFEALSYHWGTEMSHEPVYFLEDDLEDNHQATQAQFSASIRPHPAEPEIIGDHALQKIELMIARHHYFPKKNLYRALARLRQPYEDVLLWVDAICIDQSNNHERSLQVQRMSEIYAAATTVVIWLGDGDDRTSQAMQFVNDLLTEPTKITEYVEQDEHTVSWQNLLHLMRSTWFSRRWVIQELALASDAVVLCGAKSVHWTDLQDAISIFTSNFDIIRERFKRSAQRDYNALGEIEPLHAKKLVDNITSIFRRHPHTPDRRMEPLLGLEYLVSSLAILDAADPRDTINAYRNICKETFRHRENGPQKHGYTVDLLTVYVSFVKWVVEETGCLDIICRRWAIPEKSVRDPDGNYPDLVSLPSWIQVVEDDDRSNAVPGQRRHGDTFVSLPGERAYKACHNLRASVEFRTDKFQKQQQRRDQHQDSQASRVQPEVLISPPPTKIMTSVDQNGSVQLGAQNLADDQDASDNRSPSPYSETMSEGNERNVALQQKVLSAWQPKFHNGQATADNSSNKLNLHLHPDGSKRPRGMSVSSSTPGSPTSVHLPDLRGKAVLQQLLVKNIDASIVTKGIPIGTVKHICLMTDGVIGRDVFFELYGTQRIERGEDPPEVVWRTLVAERGPNNTVPPALYARACRYAMSFLNLNKDLNVKELRERSQADFIKPFLKRVEAVIWNRCFFKVRDLANPAVVYRGFAPYTARDDDILCILYGCNVPCILRPWSSRRIGGTYYSMIGEAYVNGIMDGDFIESLGEDVANRTEDFRIL